MRERGSWVAWKPFVDEAHCLNTSTLLDWNWYCPVATTVLQSGSTTWNLGNKGYLFPSSLSHSTPSNQHGPHQTQTGICSENQHDTIIWTYQTLHTINTKATQCYWLITSLLSFCKINNFKNYQFAFIFYSFFSILTRQLDMSS